MTRRDRASESVRTLFMTCLGCAGQFEPRRRDMVYCAAACRARAWRERHVARLLSHLPLLRHYLPPAVEAELLEPMAEAIRGTEGEIQ